MVTLSALASRFRRPLRTHPWHWLLGGWASSLILLWLWKLLTQTHISWLDAWQWTQLWLWLLLAILLLPSTTVTTAIQILISGIPDRDTRLADGARSTTGATTKALVLAPQPHGPG